MAGERSDLLQGTLDLVVLRILKGGDHHGYAIAKKIQILSKEFLLVKQGSLYPALHRLEKRGWVTANWGVTETKRKAKFYQLTPDGRRQIEEETAYWKRFSGAINLILRDA